MRYSVSKNSVTLETGSAIVNSSIFYSFWVIWRWILSWPWNLGYRSLKIIQIGTIRKLGCSFLFVFHSNYGSILHHLWDKARYWSKIVTFSYPLTFDAPVGILPSRLVWENWNGGATRRWENFEDMCNRLDSIPACDRRTDRRTDRERDGHLATAYSALCIRVAR